MVGPKEAVVQFFKRYVDFRGRSTRAEFWWPHLFVLLVVVMVSGLLHAIEQTLGSDNMRVLVSAIGGALFIFMVAVLIPSVAVFVRRLHDINRSGILAIPIYLVGFIPLVGLLSTIAIIVIGSIESTAGPNRYGEPSSG